MASLVEHFGNLVLAGLTGPALTAYVETLKKLDVYMDELEGDSKFLEILENNGVDNWEGYEDSRREFKGE